MQTPLGWVKFDAHGAPAAPLPPPGPTHGSTAQVTHADVTGILTEPAGQQPVGTPASAAAQQAAEQSAQQARPPATRPTFADGTLHRGPASTPQQLAAGAALFSRHNMGESRTTGANSSDTVRPTAEYGTGHHIHPHPPTPSHSGGRHAENDSDDDTTTRPSRRVVVGVVLRMSSARMGGGWWVGMDVVSRPVFGCWPHCVGAVGPCCSALTHVVA